MTAVDTSPPRSGIARRLKQLIVGTPGARRSAYLRNGIVLALVAMIGFGGGVAFADDYLRPNDPDNPTSMRGCVIRFDKKSSSGTTVVPRIHANSAHICVGVTSVSVDSTSKDLILRNSSGRGVVVTMIVSPDETLTRKGISCGGSGGSTLSRVICYDRAGHHVPANSLKMYGATSNLWVSWTMWHN